MLHVEGIKTIRLTSETCIDRIVEDWLVGQVERAPLLYI